MADAVRALALAGFDMARWSVITKVSSEEEALGYYTSGVRFQIWGPRRRDWQCLWSALLGSAFFFMPKVGPLVVLGPLVGAVVEVLDGLARRGASGALVPVLVNLGIDNDCACEYENAVAEGLSLMLVQGSTELINESNAVLRANGSAPLLTHSMPLETLLSRAVAGTAQPVHTRR